jgi:predicted DNA-binding transcriptional regulator YafY
MMKRNQTALIRQTTIFNRLNMGETLNVKALATEFGVSVRTIQKDFNERLCQTYDIVDLGHGNYAFAEGLCYKGAEDEETKIAISLMKSLQHHAVPQMDSFVDSAIEATKYYEEMFIFDLDFEEILDMNMFKVILKAIQWKLGISFEYTRYDGKCTEVTVHPYRIANFGSFWYLIAYDLKYEQIKSYYFGSIEKLKTLYENFTDDPKVEQALKDANSMDSVWYKNESLEVILRIKDDAMHYLSRKIPSRMEIIEHNDVWMRCRLHYYHEKELFTFVRKWIPDIRIEDERLQKRFEDVLNYYLSQR